jgi:hypothetical protein
MCGDYSSVHYKLSEVLGKENAGQVEALEFEEESNSCSVATKGAIFICTDSEGRGRLRQSSLYSLKMRQSSWCLITRYSILLHFLDPSTHFSNSSQLDMKPQDFWQLDTHVSVANSGLMVPHPSLSIMVSKPWLQVSWMEARTHRVSVDVRK